ncbi:unnamed protein product [Trichobilharzia regenti]|nr:unnamed protein product [Trichobilharzia regenti]
MIENGIKPVYVFEGKPPSMKAGELAKRAERRVESSKELAKAEAEEDLEAIEKFSKRLVKVTPAHNEDCRQLLTLMGVPFINVSPFIMNLLTYLLHYHHCSSFISDGEDFFFLAFVVFSGHRVKRE